MSIFREQRKMENRNPNSLMYILASNLMRKINKTYVWSLRFVWCGGFLVLKYVLNNYAVYPADLAQ